MTTRADSDELDPRGVGRLLAAVYGDRDVGKQAEAILQEAQDLTRLLLELLLEFKQRDVDILRERFGLQDGRARTLADTGRKFYLTAERVRQIQQTLLSRMRHPTKLREFERFFDGDNR